MASFSIATSESWRDKASGQMREKSEWHRIAVFGKTAEFAANYLHKGSQVYIEGQLQTRKWQDNNGQERYTTEVVVRWPLGNLQLTGSKSPAEPPTQPVHTPETFSPPQAPKQPVVNESTNWDVYDDDIPF